MSLSKLRELQKLEDEIFQVTQKSFQVVITHGLLGEHLTERYYEHPEGQVDPDAHGSINIFRLVGSGGENTASCRSFSADQEVQIELDILLELFNFDGSAYGDIIEQARPGFYHVHVKENISKYINGKHLAVKQTKQLVDCLQDRDPHNVFKRFQTLFHDVDWFSDPDTVQSFLAKADGCLPPDFLKKVLLLNCKRVLRNSGNPNKIFGNVIPQNLQMDWEFLTEINGPAVTNEIQIALKFVCGTYSAPVGKGSLSLDLVSCAKLNIWPVDASAFLTRERHWPSKSTIKECETEPVHLVPKFSKVGDENEWYLSFTQQEKIIADARSASMKFTFYLFKVLFYSHVKKYKLIVNGIEESLSTYLAKTTMLWTCEELAPEEWTEENAQRNLSRLFRKLLGHLSEGRLPHYFIPDINLLENTPPGLLWKVYDSLKGSDLVCNSIASLPTEEMITDVLSKRGMIFEFIRDNSDKISNVLALNPWGIIEEHR